MSLTIVEHDSRVDRLCDFFSEKFDMSKETPHEYIYRITHSANPWNGYAKTPNVVAREIWKRTTALVNRKYRIAHTNEQMYVWETNQTGTYVVKTGKHQGYEYVTIKNEFIWLRSRPKWYSVSDGNEAPFNKIRYHAGEIFPVIESGNWYSLTKHRFVKFEEVKNVRSA